MHSKYKNVDKWQTERGKRYIMQTLLIRKLVYLCYNQTRETSKQETLPDIRERHFVVIGPIYQEDITKLNICVSNRASNYMRQKLTELKRGIYQSIIRVGGLNTPSLV